MALVQNPSGNARATEELEIDGAPRPDLDDPLRVSRRAPVKHLAQFLGPAERPKKQTSELDELAKRLRQARTDAGFKRFDDAAEATGISVNTIKSYEYGKFVPSALNLATLAKTFSVSPDWLLGLNQDRSGLPAGKALVDLDIADGILAAETEEEVRQYVQRLPSMVLCIVEIPGRAKILKLNEAMALGQRLQSKIQRLSPELAKRWEQVEKILDPS